MPYKIPVTGINDVQLYIPIGPVKPTTIQLEVLFTCGPSAGAVEPLTTSTYVIGQDTNGNWYGVFKNFDSVGAVTCFVIAITINGQMYFSEEYCIETGCSTDDANSGLQMVQGCYGNIDNKLSYDCEGIYFGTHAGPDTSLGDETVTYRHQLLLRGIEITLASIKNSFKQGRTRNFRTEKEKIYQFYAEFIPEWYMPEVDAVFYRGEVIVGSTRYLVNETQFEKIEDCKKMWKPTVTFKNSCYQSFSCEADPCAPPVRVCCDPLGISITVEDVSGSSSSSGSFCCDPIVLSVTVEETSTEQYGFVVDFDWTKILDSDDTTRILYQ